MTLVHIKAIFVIYVLAGGMFLLCSRFYIQRGMSPEIYWRRAAGWMAISTAAFVSTSFWIFAFLLFLIVLLLKLRDKQAIALYAFLAFCIPPYSSPLPGLGAINYLLDLNYLRVLNLGLLLPLCVGLLSSKRSPPSGWMRIVDLWVIGYILLRLTLIGTSGLPMTVTIREGLGMFIDVVIPYFAVTRSLSTREDVRDVMGALVLGWLAVAPIAVFENLKGWLLYPELIPTLDLKSFRHVHLSRGDSLRAAGPGGHPLVMGLFMMVALCFIVSMGLRVRRSLHFLLVAIICAGLWAPLSRGPWLGAAIALVIYLLISRDGIAKLTKLGGVGLLVLPVVLISPLGPKIIDHLPFIGTLDSETVVFRQELLKASIEVIMQNPWLGSFTYETNHAFTHLMQGDGFIDFVNTYVIIALSTGMFGLLLYVGVFVLVLFATFQAWLRSRNRDAELDGMGRSIFAASIGMMVFVATCSPIVGVITLKILLAGLALAYARLRPVTVTAKAAAPKPRMPPPHHGFRTA